MNEPTDPSPLLFAEYLPLDLEVLYENLCWRDKTDICGCKVIETEYLDLCHRIEERMTDNYYHKYQQLLVGNVHATWQQRLSAIHETLKGTKL